MASGRIVVFALVHTRGKLLKLRTHVKIIYRFHHHIFHTTERQFKHDLEAIKRPLKQQLWHRTELTDEHIKDHQWIQLGEDYWYLPERLVTQIKGLQ
jgi:primosomal protein N''